ncbi:unnamed protein product [Hymenolepis diminuta]|uniref:Uncharacterized protein n=1 Tax=Hymenolepis diminuta TaxID=6216 RepID=A0A564YQL4_HYMDI|nr:unnamed protein product [Hymenolepis diminuta]
MYIHSLLVLSPLLKTLFNLPPHHLACLDPNSLELVAVEELTSLLDWQIMYNNQLSSVFIF